MAAKVLLIFSALFGIAFSEVIPVESCSDSCEIKEVRITPCENPPQCAIKKGSTVNFSFDFTPEFSSHRIMTGAFWHSDGSNVRHKEFENADGCLYSSCPVQAYRKQTFNRTLIIASSLPSGTYNFEWRIWKRNNLEDSRKCCFVTKLRRTN